MPDATTSSVIDTFMQAASVAEATAALSVTGVIVGTTQTQTLTNKTISGAANTITNIDPSQLTTGTGAVSIVAGGTNQNVQITPSGTGFLRVVSSGLGNSHYFESDVAGNIIRMKNANRVYYSAIDFQAWDSDEGEEDYGGAVGYGNVDCQAVFADSCFLEAYELRGSVTAPPAMRMIQTGNIASQGQGRYLRQEVTTDGQIYLYKGNAVYPNQDIGLWVGRQKGVGVNVDNVDYQLTNGGTTVTNAFGAGPHVQGAGRWGVDFNEGSGTSTAVGNNYSVLNDGGNVVRTAAIVGDAPARTAGSETGRLQFFTKPSGSAVAVAMTIDQNQDVTCTNGLYSNDALAGIGYATGAGGTVTQSTSKSTGVTLNKVTGAITTHNASLASNAVVTFTVTCSPCANTSLVNINHISGGSLGSYLVTAHTVGTGSFQISIRNLSGGPLAEALVLRYSLERSVDS